MDIQGLSISERIHLAEKLWDSVREESKEIEVTPQQAELLDRRLASLKADGDLGDSWDNVKARIVGDD